MTKNVFTINQLFSAIAAVSIVALMTGCGGGDSASTTTSTTLSGTFVDAPVAGLNYNCTSGLQGKTDTAGTFLYKAGDTCEFKIGSLSLGSVAVTGVTTPYILADGNTTIAGNIAALLQTLDGDTNASKISISSDHNLTAGSFDFRSATFDTALGLYAAAHNLIHVNPAQAIEAMNGYLFPSFSDKTYIMTADSTRMEFYKNGQFVQIDPDGEIKSGLWTSQNGTAATVILQDDRRIAITILSSTSASIKFEGEAAVAVSYTVQNTNASVWHDPRNTASEVFKDLNITNLNDHNGALTRWDYGTLIPVKLNGSRVAEEAINRIEAVLGRVVFDRTSIANTPEGDITRGITVSEMTTLIRSGADWNPCGEQTGTLNGKQHLDIGSANCSPTTAIAIHEFSHALGMRSHYEGYGVGASIGGGFWSVLKTMYSNAIGATKANILVHWGVTENNITGATTAASGL